MVRLWCPLQLLLLITVAVVVWGQMEPEWKHCGTLNFCIIHTSCIDPDFDEAARNAAWRIFRNIGKYPRETKPPGYDVGCNRYITISPQLGGRTVKVRMRDQKVLKGIGMRIYFKKKEGSGSLHQHLHCNKNEIEVEEGFDEIKVDNPIDEAQKTRLKNEANTFCIFDLTVKDSSNNILEEIQELSGGKFEIASEKDTTSGNPIRYSVELTGLNFDGLKIPCEDAQLTALDIDKFYKVDDELELAVQDKKDPKPEEKAAPPNSLNPFLVGSAAFFMFTGGIALFVVGLPRTWKGVVGKFPKSLEKMEKVAQTDAGPRFKDEFLYHFGISTTAVDMLKTFGDVKFVCAGGSNLYAEEFAREIGVPKSANLSRSDRFVIYKTGPVLWINYGMGAPSLSIMLVETLKLLHHAKATDVCFVRLGTSGGVGVAPGTVVISSGALNGELNEEYVQWSMGKKIVIPTHLCPQLSADLSTLAVQMKLRAEEGVTLCYDVSYEYEMRLGGFFCEYTEADKLREQSFLSDIHSRGVRNIETESTIFAAITGRGGVKAAIVRVALIDHMVDDQVTLSKEMYIEYETRPFKLVSALIRKKLKI